MTDVSPPFRLDQGGEQPGTLTVDAPTAPRAPEALDGERIALLVGTDTYALVSGTVGRRDLDGRDRVYADEAA